MTVIIFILVLAVLIFVHELGHFILARANGIRVDAFKIGFGPRIVHWKRGETEYGVNLIPFGGFVKIHGEDPSEKPEGDPDSARSFMSKNRWRQASVLVAGVAFNFLFAYILYVYVFSTGVTATMDGFQRYASDFSNERIMITYIDPGSPAEKAGLQLGDVVTSVDSKPVSSIEQIQNNINDSKGAPISIAYSRARAVSSTTVAAVTGLVPGKYAVGIAMDNVGDLKLPFFTSVWEGLRYTWFMMRDTAVGLYTFVAGLFQGTASLSDVAGPVGIAGIVGNAAELGFTYLVMITALISINLGIINLIPFPALDGGRILFVALEGAFRRRISAKFVNAVNAVGFVLLMILMVAVTYKDIANLISPK
ncbi:MAG: site-2 protease family protein [Patescibacteria group bacterium]|nr:site-2 protease family protein [Patescibacteria group bacterium]MDE1966867.1 site-2 protease family protein [Patescibacteria group bacterium]